MGSESDMLQWIVNVLQVQLPSCSSTDDNRLRAAIDISCIACAQYAYSSMHGLADG